MAALSAVAADINYPNGSTNSTPIVLTDNSTQLQVLTGSATQSGVISQTGGARPLSKIGAGTLILTGANSYTGQTSIAGGALQIGNGSTTGSIAGSVTDNASLVFNRSDAIVFSNVISGTGSVSQTGSGTLTLSGTNTYSGGTIISGAISPATLAIASDNALGALLTPITLQNGTLKALAPLILNRPVTLVSANGAVNTFDTNGFDVGLFRPIGGSGSLTKTGSGSLTISGSNSYQGQTFVLAGRLVTGTAATIPATTSLFVAGGATFDFDRNSQTLANLTGSGSVVGLGDLTIGGGRFDGVITARGSLRITGDAIFSNVNAISDETRIAGSLSLVGSGSIATSQLALEGGTFDISGTTAGASVTSIKGTGRVLLGNQTLTVVDPNPAPDQFFYGVISGTGGVIFTRQTVYIRADQAYTGGTTINLGHIYVGLGTAGSIQGNVVNNGILTFGTGTSVYAGSISGTGSVETLGGTIMFTGNSTYTGGTTVSFGTLQIGNGGTTGSVLGPIVLQDSTLIINRSDTVTIDGPITMYDVRASQNTNTKLVQAGTGTVILAGAATLAGGTTINAGTLQIGNGGTSGALASAVTDNGALVFNRSDAVSFANIISGTGTVTQAGSGLLTLTAANSYTGGTTIAGGSLQIGNGGTSGSITGNIIDNALLIFNRADDITFSGNISGTGSVTKMGAGTLTLVGVNAHAGGTMVNAGALNVLGKTSGVHVAGGATLTGTGTVGTTAIDGGGTLMPGAAMNGTLSVNGNLVLAPDAGYVAMVTPGAATLTSISGTASLNGNFSANLASGEYVAGQRYTVLSAAGGITGTFSTLTTSGVPRNVRGRLSYSASDVFLNLDPNALTPYLPTPATQNQQRVAAAIDAAVAQGAMPAGGFLALYSLSGTALAGALDQIGGQLGPNIASAVGQNFVSFLSMSNWRGSAEAGSFAPGTTYGNADAPHRAQLSPGTMQLWGSGYVGHLGLGADAISGAAGLSSQNFGFVGGIDRQVDNRLLVGGVMGIGHQGFTSGNGEGNSTDYMLGLHALGDFDDTYVSGAVGYGWHQIKTYRTVTVSGQDLLQGKENASNIGGRLEAGWHVRLDEILLLTPYAAFVGVNFHSPAYVESARAGTTAFALSYAARDDTIARTEVGARLGQDFALSDGTLAANLSAGWGHELDSQPFALASFQSLPLAGFKIAGVRADDDAVLLGLDVQVLSQSGLTFGMKVQSQLGANTNFIEGMGNMGWRW